MTSIAVVCRAKAFNETRRKIGWFSYPVPDLEWTFYPCADGDAINKNELAQKHDLIFWEDWCWPTFAGKSAIPVYAAIVDSNTSARRRKLYLERAKQASVLLIDQDKLSTFKGMGKPVFRWQYAVNEYVFAPGQKDVDVAYHVERTPERSDLVEPIRNYCQSQGYSLTTGGGMTIDQYAARLGAARVVVHKATHEQCRSHRFFDALAAGACLLTDKVLPVAEDGFICGQHFQAWDNPKDLTGRLTYLLATGKWEVYAQAGRAHVLRHHTWSVRAAQLQNIIEGTYAKR